MNDTNGTNDKKKNTNSADIAKQALRSVGINVDNFPPEIADIEIDIEEDDADPE